MNFDSPFSLGVFIGATLEGVPPEQIPYLEGMAKAADSMEADAANRLILRQAAEIMERSEYARGAPACHLKLASISTAPDARYHRQELTQLVAQVLRSVAPLHKQASSIAALASMLGAAAKTTAIGVAGVGALGGAGMWKVQDQLKKDDLKAKARESAADYYRSLTGQLNGKMRDKYQYEEKEEAPKDFVSRRRSKEMEQLLNRTKYRWDTAQPASVPA